MPQSSSTLVLQSRHVRHQVLWGPRASDGAAAGGQEAAGPGGLGTAAVYPAHGQSQVRPWDAEGGKQSWRGKKKIFSSLCNDWKLKDESLKAAIDEINQSFGLFLEFSPYSFFLSFFVVRQNPWCPQTHSQHLSPWQPVHPGQRAVEADQGRRRRQVTWPRPLPFRTPKIPFHCFSEASKSNENSSILIIWRLTCLSLPPQAARRHGDRRVSEHRLPALGHALPVHADGQPDHSGPAQRSAVSRRHGAAGRRHLHVRPACRPPRRHREYKRWERCHRKTCVLMRCVGEKVGWYNKDATVWRYSGLPLGGTAGSDGRGGW